jgi:hypothetical protein
MSTQIAFTKNPTLHNILFDEFFAEYSAIEVIAFNYDGVGTALCCCDGALSEIPKANLRKIIFGCERASLQAYLQGIFDPEAETDAIHRQNDTPIFRLAELNRMKRYDVANLAKKTLQEVHDGGATPFRYYTQTSDTPCAAESR